MIGRDTSKPRRGTTVATEDIRERLARLPRRAVVAFAARCARRVQPRTHALPQQGRDAIDRAIASAEAFAKGDSRVADAAEAAARAAAAEAADAWNATWAADADSRAAARVAAAAWGADAAAWAAARAAARAAADAWAADAAEATDAAWAADAAEAAAAAAADAAAARAATRTATSSDLDRLIALNLGQPGTLGAPIDPSEAGPLGPLWPQGVPEWYTEAATGTGTPHEEPSGDAD
jgi:hypothetical protein